MMCLLGAAADVGDDPRLGSVMKLVGNFNIASIIELISEAMTLGERSGLSRDMLLQFYSFMLPGIQIHRETLPRYQSDLARPIGRCN